MPQAETQRGAPQWSKRNGDRLLMHWATLQLEWGSFDVLPTSVHGCDTPDNGTVPVDSAVDGEMTLSPETAAIAGEIRSEGECVRDSEPRHSQELPGGGDRHGQITGGSGVMSQLEHSPVRLRVDRISRNCIAHIQGQFCSHGANSSGDYRHQDVGPLHCDLL